MREAWLDVVRALAATSVLFQHTMERAYPAFYLWTAQYFNFGLFGVTLFFVASGYIIPVSLDKAGTAKFWNSRFFRLFPLYWVSIIAAVLLGISDLSWGQTALNFTMMQEWFGVPHVLLIYWTLSTELVFYITITILYQFKAYQKWDRSVMLGVFLLGAIAITLITLSTGKQLPLGRFENLIAFFLGMTFHAHSKGKALRISPKLMSISILLILSWAAFVRFPSIADVDLNHEYTYSYFGIAMTWFLSYGVFSWFYSRGDQIQYPQWILRIGGACYGTYLIHALVLDSTPQTWNPFLQLLFVGSVTIALALLSWKYFEEPFIQLGRKLVSRPKPMANTHHK